MNSERVLERDNMPVKIGEQRWNEEQARRSISAMRRLEHRIRTWWQGRYVYLEGPPPRLLHDLHWTARICRTVWMTVALCGLIAETALFYIARLLTGRRDMRSGWF